MLCQAEGYELHISAETLFSARNLLIIKQPWNLSGQSQISLSYFILTSSQYFLVYRICFEQFSFPCFRACFYLLMLIELRTAVITALIHGVMSVTGIFTKNAGKFALYQKGMLIKK